MRVLWVHNFDPASPAAGVFMRTFVGAIQSQGVDPDVYYAGNLRSPRQIAATVSHLRSMPNAYDIVHSQFGSAVSCVALAAPGSRHVLTLRGSDWYRNPGRHNSVSLHSAMATALTRTSIPKYDGVITVSNRMFKEVSAAYPTKQLSAITDPIDLGLFRPRDVVEARSRLRLRPPPTKYILFTSVDARRAVKQPQLANNAVAYVRERLTDVELLVASGYEPSEMPWVTAAADVLLLTSRSEGWPNCVKEALACGIPFVATDVSDLNGVADHSPGCYVTKSDPQALGEALIRALEVSPPIPHLQQALSGFTKEEAAHKLLSFYDKLLMRPISDT